MSTDPPTAQAGPIRHATLIVADFAPLVAAYAHLGLVPSDEARIDANRAAAWGPAAVALTGCRDLWLGPAGEPALLHLIERPGTAARPTRREHGWLALEILVRDVDAIAARLAAAGGGGFELIGPAADLDVSPAIRAMQLVGPSGEMLYLTQVKAPVPPFVIPLSSTLPLERDLGALFIAVLSTPSREATLAACTTLGAGTVLRFDTRITVLNRALGRPLDTRWPVATVQWAGQSLFEIDEVVAGEVRPATCAPGAGLPAGLAWVTIQGSDADRTAGLRELSPGAWLECAQLLNSRTDSAPPA
ncbi:MAG: hypothetical protein ACKOB5_00205 [Betaproteobacteria bacterium]